MPTYTIIGQLSSTRKQALSKLKISAWDKDKNVSDHLGTAYTDTQGMFSMSFDDDRFFDGAEDNLPDIFFLVYHGDRVIHSTENTPIKNAKELTKVAITLDEEATGNPKEEALYTLSGNVLNQNNKLPVQDLKVEAWDKDKKISDQLGLALTDKAGGFEIAYEPSRFRDNPNDHWPNVFFRIYRGEDMIHSTERTPLKKVKHRSGIEIHIDEALTSDSLTSKLPKEILKNLSAYADRTPASLKKSQPKLYHHLLAKAQKELLRQATRFFESTSRNLSRTIKNLDPSELTNTKQNTVDYLAEEIEKTSLSTSLKREGLDRLKQWEGSKNLEELIQPGNPIAEHPLLTEERQRGDLFKITELAKLQDAVGEKLIVSKLKPHELNAASVGKLVSDKIITKKQGQTLQFNAGVFSLSQGNLKLAKAMKAQNPKKSAATFEDLAKFEVKDWKAILKKGQVTGSQDDLQKQALIKQKQLELSFPEVVFKQKSATLEAPRPRRLLNRFYKANKDFQFLNANLETGGSTVENLNFNGFTVAEKQTVLQELRTNKSLFQLTKDSEHALELKQMGYRAGYEIAMVGFSNFKKQTGYSDALAKRYFDSALNEAFRTNIALGNAFDAHYTPINHRRVMAFSGETQEYLRGLNGYETFFGETDYCKCAHCASIISPAAYFVDLMDFLGQHVINDHFPAAFPTGDEVHTLDPRVRRADLWKGLVLNCDNTHKLEPYLTIINEILENFIYLNSEGSPYTDLPTDRGRIETQVYNLLHKEDESDAAIEIDSFSQPFHLALTQLEIYLRHFPLTRYELAKIWFKSAIDSQGILPSASLGISSKEYALIKNPRAGDLAFIRKLYGIRGGSGIPQQDVQHLLATSRLSRSQFTELIASYFVKSLPEQEVRIITRRTADAIQPNKEYAQVTAAQLDRIHRFTRLWRRLDWSIEELDKVIYHLHQAKGISDRDRILLYPEEIAQLSELQKSLRIGVDELCTLVHEFPITGSPSFFDSRFNMEAFVKNEANKWTVSASGEIGTIGFRHPAYGPSTDDGNVLHRLLAGLQLNDEQLFSLIEALGGHLELLEDPSDSGSFTLSLEKLSTLFRHALLMKKYRLDAASLFFLIRIHPEISSVYLSNHEEVKLLTELIQWAKESGHTLAELAHILNESLDGSVPVTTAAEMAYNLWFEVQEKQHLLFADTLFAYEGISETQSEAIIEANSAVIVSADLQKFKLFQTAKEATTYNITVPVLILRRLSKDALAQLTGSVLDTLASLIIGTVPNIPGDVFADVLEITAEDSLAILNANPALFENAPGSSDVFQPALAVQTDPGVLNLALPAGIWASLDSSQQQSLYISLLRYLASGILPGAREISDRLFVGVANLSLEQSRTVLQSFSSLFETVKSEKLYWLSADFNSESPLIIPPDIPLNEERVRQELLMQHASKIVPNLIGANLGVPTEKVEVLTALVAYDFNRSENARVLTNILQGRASLGHLEMLVSQLEKLSIWFKDSVFNEITLQFIAENSAVGSGVFKVGIPVNYVAPQWEHLQEVQQYKTHLKKHGDDSELLHKALLHYDFDRVDPKFSSEGLTAVSSLLNVENSLLGVLNENILFPSSGSSGSPENNSLRALEKFGEIIALVQQLGIGAEAMPSLISDNYKELERASQTLLTAIRTKYDSEEGWEEKITPFEDKIRERKRDALTDYLIRTWQSTLSLDERWFKVPGDLYNYFLIDTEMEGCARTSRLVAGISSLQLYIQRCLMNLEQSRDGSIHIGPSDIPIIEWTWRKNYRIWEANRKVFLYPENYIEPDLRDNKTELFQTLESELLQQEITPQNVVDAYGKYLRGFEQIANLRIAGAYHEKNSKKDLLHLFGVSNGEAKEYFYRTVQNIYKSQNSRGEHEVIHSSWKRLGLEIPVKNVSPIVYKGKLYVFWTEVNSRPKPKSEWNEENRAEYVHTYRIKYSHKRLDDTWEPVKAVIFVSGNLKTDNVKTDERTTSPLNENYTKQDWNWIRVFPDIDERTGRLTLGGNFLNHELNLFNGTQGRPVGRIDSYPLDFPIKRLLKEDGSLGYWTVNSSSYGFKYSLSSLAFQDDNLYVLIKEQLLETSDNSNDSILVNGSLSDVFINQDDDLLYLHCDYSWKPYALKRLGTTLASKIAPQIFEYGLDSFLNINYQRDHLVERSIEGTLNDAQVWEDTHDEEGNIISVTQGFLGVYYREMLFHIPFLIANHLNSKGKYAEAQRWYDKILNPTANISSGLGPSDESSNEVWQYIEFRNHTLAGWKANLNDSQALESYKKDPFNPHAIARLRLGAYMKCIMMKYIDNLLDWGDQLFAQDTMESINEATLLYMMAFELLGERPAELGACKKAESEDLNFQQIKARMEGRGCRNFLNEVGGSFLTGRRPPRPSEEPTDFYIPLGDSFLNLSEATNWANLFFGTSGSSESPTTEDGVVALETPTIPPERLGDIQNYGASNDAILDWKDKFDGVLHFPSFHTSFLKQSCAFCIPPNPDFLAYWDRVEDRLFKIRNCMNISGIRRQLALFAPEIDPRLLVRAKAVGLSLEDVLTATQGKLPPYRFAFLLAKAKEYAGALQGFGGALLGALEKKNAEDMTWLRLRQQDEILKVFTTQLRDLEVQAAKFSLEAAVDRRQSVLNRINHFSSLVNEGLSDLEVASEIMQYVGYGFKGLAIPFAAVAGVAAIPPSILGFSFSSPSRSVEKSCEILASIMNMTSELSHISANMIGKHAGYERRSQGWQFSLQQAQNELVEINKQIEAVKIRRDISIKSRELHEKTLEQHQETFEFYRDKFTNLGLYTWLSTQLQRLYRETYQNAMTIARMAERAYRFERDDETSIFLDGNYWESSKAGLMAGEKLMAALRRMELSYMETNNRSMEIDQAFSLIQIAPEALMSLKSSGSCEFTVPELYFDLYYPGQYRRRIKSARLTIPCITGPYSNVSATLTLKDSHIRKEAKWGTEELVMVPPSRSTTVATSNAQNDSGVFRLDFRDERYMPFEGAGAVESTWLLELPKNLKPFDYDSINDVILHISYTAEYDVLFREEVERGSGHLETLLSSEGFSLSRAFSIRQEFSQTFYRLMQSGVGESIPFELSEKHFPMFLQGKTLSIENAKLIVGLDENGFRNEDGDYIPPSSTTFSLRVEANGSANLELDSWIFNTDHKYLEVNVAAGTVFSPFAPVTTALGINFEILNPGILAFEGITPSDTAVLDHSKIKDVSLVVVYRVIP